jgi:hypothetical protein
MPGVSNLLGRWLKVSDKGIGDIDEHLLAADDKARANTRLGVQEIQRKLLNNEGMTNSEKLLMRDPYAIRYFWDTWQPNALNFLVPDMKRLENRTPEQKALLLEQNP